MNRTCNKCGWVAFGITIDFATKEVEKFNKYFDRLSKEEQDDYCGARKSHIADYEHCTRCYEHYGNFKDSEPGDCPDGCTISPIIVEEKI